MNEDIEDKDFEELPVEAYREEILRAVRGNQTIICIGETGSGKTTRLPVFLLNDGFCSGGRRIAVTQPRRIAAITVAQRVSDEMKTRVGNEVGYVVRFDEKVSDLTKIKYMTDGILIRECLSDRMLSSYSVIMLDEAHERSLNTDILFGLLKEACRIRQDLKLVITSATLNTEKFGKYFNRCPIISIPGRNFPVDIYHSKTKQIMTASGPANNSYIQAAVDVVMRIHRRDEPGHILVFLTGQEEIERAVQLIRAACDEDEQSDRALLVLPLYAALPSEAQALIFQKPQVLWQRLSSSSSRHAAATNKEPRMIRKCIVATNIAETSLTVPHVRFVVDAGYVKQKVFDPSAGQGGGGVEGLLVVPISKTSALQRAGRAGRTSSGQCYRLYSSECFDDFLDETVPEIQRTALANTVLYLKALGIRDVLGFDFLDRPSSAQVLQALTQLHLLGAIDALGGITSLGHKMSQMPLDPHISRMVIQAAIPALHCLEDMVVIAAMMSVENIWITPRAPRSTGKEKENGGQHRQDRKNLGYGYDSRQHQLTAAEERAETMHAGLRRPAGDLHTLRHVYLVWAQEGDFRHDWCERHFIHYRAMKQARKIQEHLAQDVQKLGLVEFATSHPELVPYSAQSGSSSLAVTLPKSLEDRLSAAILAGYFMQAAVTCHAEGLFKTLSPPSYSSASSSSSGTDTRRFARGDGEGGEYDENDGEGERLLVQLFPSSSLQFRSPPPECLVFVEVVRGAKLLIRTATAVPKALLRAHRRAVVPVPAMQLSSGQLQPVIVNKKRPRTEEQPPDVNTEEKEVEAAHSSSSATAATASAVEEAKLRYLQRKRR